MSCTDQIDYKLLIGSWTAGEFLEDDTVKIVDLNSINFSFYNNNTYAFRGIMNKEAGNFYLKGNLLYSTDTLTNERIEKSVKVIKTTTDSLFFEMNNGGIKQIIKLYKTE
jgi:hypothetical protein